MLFGYAASTTPIPPRVELDPAGRPRFAVLVDRREGARKRVSRDGQVPRPRVADLRTPGGQVADEHAPVRGGAQLVRVARLGAGPVDRVADPLRERPEVRGRRGRGLRADPAGGRRRAAADARELPRRHELHRARRRRVIDLDLVVHLRVADVDALRVAGVQHGDASAREPRGDRALGARLLPDDRVGAGEGIRGHSEVRLGGADVDTRRQVAHVDLSVRGLRDLVGRVAPRSEPVDRMPDGPGQCRDGRRLHVGRGALGSRVRGAAIVVEHEPCDESGGNRHRDNRSDPKARPTLSRGVPAFGDPRIEVGATARNEPVCRRRLTSGPFDRRRIARRLSVASANWASDSSPTDVQDAPHKVAATPRSYSTVPPLTHSRASLK